MAYFSAALLALLVASCATAALATTFYVGDRRGWNIGVDYPAWTTGKTFAVGDTLVFNYTSKVHTVTEVGTKRGFDACSFDDTLSNDDSGATTVTLTTAGVHYFICHFLGDCDSGMKLAVNATVAGGDVGSTTGSTMPAGGDVGSTTGSTMPAGGDVGSTTGSTMPAGGDVGSTTGSTIPAGDAGGSLVPATRAVSAAAAGALLKLALF